MQPDREKKERRKQSEKFRIVEEFDISCEVTIRYKGDGYSNTTLLVRVETNMTKDLSLSQLDSHVRKVIAETRDKAIEPLKVLIEEREATIRKVLRGEEV